jgi:hypothetical protein
LASCDGMVVISPTFCLSFVIRPAGYHISRGLSEARLGYRDE